MSNLTGDIVWYYHFRTKKPTHGYLEDQAIGVAVVVRAAVAVEVGAAVAVVVRAAVAVVGTNYHMMLQVKKNWQKYLINQSQRLK